MKKYYVYYFIAVVCIFLSCSKATDQVVSSDTTPPTITMLGKNPDTLIVKTVASYTDPGATASDDKDGNITSKIVVASNVNVNVVSHYLIYYTVEDNAHNISTRLTRVVEVVKADATYDASYSCSGSTSNSIIITSYSNNDSIKIKNIFFSGDSVYAGLNNFKYKIVPMTVMGTTINGELTANGTTLNGNMTFTGTISGSCTGTFIRH